MISAQPIPGQFLKGIDKGLTRHHVHFITPKFVLGVLLGWVIVMVLQLALNSLQL